MKNDCTPEGFASPEEIARGILGPGSESHTLFIAIAAAIADRDKLWVSRETKQKENEVAQAAGEEPEGMYGPIPPGMFGKPIC